MIIDMGIEVRGESANLRTSRILENAPVVEDVAKIEKKEAGVAQETAKILPFVRPDKNPV